MTFKKTLERDLYLFISGKLGKAYVSTEARINESSRSTERQHLKA